jgi:UDP-N-acetylmuramoyl-L-alanyl-D-glutamate--2,6-diaminopimelate ligase
MKLGILLNSAATSEVTGFAIDHRKVAPGTIFGAFQGAKVNGEDYIPAAIASGAIAIVARPGVPVDGAAHVAAENPRHAFAHLAARYFAPFPGHLVAVTGTNGKTSTVELTRQLWRMAGLSAASIGTLGITTSDEQVVTGLTTPDVATFLSNLAGLEREGVSHVAFEASSHGLDQYRIEGIKVAAAAFTNLSRDHLDYHGTMEAYFEAKMRLFTELVEEGGTAVIWADDGASNDVVAAARRQGLKIATVGVRGETLTLVERSVGHLGQNLTVEAEGQTYKIALPLIGAYQVANALTAAGLVIAAGGSISTTLANLGRVQGVRGRIERAVITKSGAPVYVDYAHTPDALEAAVAALRPHAKGRILLVFGAGGDRDPGKRREMGAIAVRDADVAIVTDDNPRSEDPMIIRRAIMAAAPGATEIGDRRAAIAAAIEMAGPDDIVLIAGKGHETGQEIKGIKHPFNDVEVARDCAA